MQKHNKKWNQWGIGCWALALTGLLVTCASVGFAQAAKKATAELLSARQSTINGRAASSGATLFNQTRVNTAKEGFATISLGQQGRMELGAAGDLTLRLSAGTIGGELGNGRLRVSAATGTGIAVQLAKATVLATGTQSTVVTIEVLGEQVRLTAQQGEARLVSEGKTERVRAGEEITIAHRNASGNWERRQLGVSGATTGAAMAGLAGNSSKAVVASAASAAQVTSQAAAQTLSKSQVTFGTLLNASMNYSLARIFAQPRDPAQFFSTNITCRDHDNVFCWRRSANTP